MNNDISSGNLTSGTNLSVWFSDISPIVLSKLEQNISTDILIIGGGIAGITTAYLLVKAGKHVVLIEDGYIGSGETGRTTAHISSAIDHRYYKLKNYFNDDEVRIASDSNMASINFINEIVQKENIDCEFERLNGYLFLHPSDKIETLNEEYRTIKDAGMQVEMVQDVPGIANLTGSALMFPSQAAFHPLKYLRRLVDVITGMGGKVFTNTKAVDIQEGVALTENGFSISANKIVVATNTPINNRFLLHTKIAPYRTYVNGYKIKKDALPHCLWWDTGDMDSFWSNSPYHYARVKPLNDVSDILLVGGEDHKTGQASKENKPEESRWKFLDDWTKVHFPMIEDLLFKWSGQIMEPLDGLGYIGKNPGDDNTYVITGHGGNGMTFGTIGGIIVSDLILGKENKWTKLYDPSRKSLQSAPAFIKEQMNVANEYLSWLTPGDINTIEELEPGAGAIMREGMKKVAVYKDTNGQIRMFSAVCPHLQCIVEWNDEEKTFDCPCHGSRYTKEGSVINGPTISPLEVIK